MTTGDGSSFEYRGWWVSIETAASGEFFAGHADLRHRGEHKCRLVLSTSRADPATARWALDSKARDYIDAWSERQHTGDTGFQEL
ncbi:hypothetical protein [Variovorax sp. PBL-E5]|uniref:hypothetical protein n=1 Tax=Variovorax sp. PBL-E5 TaxID=434014 RepID=UPI0013A5BA9E|nr:hypothetical protein [Variovorax sp. PBL-E5]